MAFGVFDTPGEAMPMGTTRLEDVLQENSKVHAKLILVPAPSTSPFDPLNLSRVRKELLFITIILGACATGVIGPVLVPGFNIIAEDFGIDLTKVTLLNGSLIMALGISSYLASCFARLYGKRIIFLSTSILLIASSCWGAAAKSYNSLLAARTFQGLGMGGFFALAGTASINDVFFVHERGRRVGLWNFAIIVSVNLTPVISGYVITNLSWQWTFWLLAILFGIELACVMFFFPETSFDRDESSRTITTPKSVSGDEAFISHVPKDHEKGDVPTSLPLCDEQMGASSSVVSLWRRVLGLRDLQIKNQRQILVVCIEPILILRHPTVIWSCAMWSVTFTWVIIQGAVADQIFMAPPYLLSTTAVGNLVGIAPLLGAALGTLVGGWSCDFIGKTLAIRNKGVYEPEFRLWVMVPFLVTAVLGSFGLGMAIHNGLSYIICGVFLAILNFAVGIGCTGIVTYSNDVCQHRAGESFGVTMLVKSAFAFGLTFMLNDYYATQGPKVFFFTWGGLTIGVTLLTIPLYVYGKRIRVWTTRHGIL